MKINVCRKHSNPLAWKIPWAEEPGGLQSMGSLRVSDTTERLHSHFSLPCIGKGNGNPLQCSCLENPRDGEPVGLLSMGSHRVGHDWSDLAAAGRIQPVAFFFTHAPTPPAIHGRKCSFKVYGNGNFWDLISSGRFLLASIYICVAKTMYCFWFLHIIDKLIERQNLSKRKYDFFPLKFTSLKKSIITI